MEPQRQSLAALSLVKMIVLPVQDKWRCLNRKNRSELEGVSSEWPGMEGQE
jgi:hypothetical protein